MNKYLGDFVSGGVIGSLISFTLVGASTGASILNSVNFGIGVAGLAVEGLIIGYGYYLHQQISQEQHLYKESPNPLTSAFMFFLGLILMGMIPLTSLFMVANPMLSQYLTYLAYAMTLLSLLLLGMIKSISLGQNILTSGFNYVLMGGGVTLIGYLVSYLLNRFVLI